MKNIKPTLAMAAVAIALSGGPAATTAGADVLGGDSTVKWILPACSANMRIVLDIDSPMAGRKAMALIGLDGPTAPAELARTQEAVKATCS